MVVNRYSKNPGSHNKGLIFGYTNEKQHQQAQPHPHTQTHTQIGRRPSIIVIRLAITKNLLHFIAIYFFQHMLTNA